MLIDVNLFICDVWQVGYWGYFILHCTVKLPLSNKNALFTKTHI